MANAGAIEFSFKGDLTQLRRDLREASRLAQQAAGEVSRSTAGGGIAGAFRRTPERRAERAISQLGAGLLTGDIGMAIAGFTEKITAFGLAAGAGVGVAIGVFEKFHHEVIETAKAFDGLQQNLHRPLAFQGALGPEAISSELESGNKALQAALEKRESIWNKLNEFLHRGTTAGQADTRFGGAPVGPAGPDLAAQHDKIIEEALQRQNQLAGIRADKELQIANLKLMSAQGYEKEAALAKITLDAEEKRAALLLNRGGNALDLFKSNLAIDAESKAARTEIEKKFPDFHVPTTSANTDFFNSPIPGGRTAEPGESQYLVNQVEANRLASERLNAGLPPASSQFQDMVPQGFFNDYLNDPQGAIDKAFFQGPRSYQGPSKGEEGIGTGIDGIKKGIDDLNQKMDRYWS